MNNGKGKKFQSFEEVNIAKAKTDIETLILKKLTSIEDKLDALLGESEPEGEWKTIVSVQHYISTSGNNTWKGIIDGGDRIYIRQSHAPLLRKSALWNKLNNIPLGETQDCEIEVRVKWDGNFLSILELGEWAFTMPLKTIMTGDYPKQEQPSPKKHDELPYTGHAIGNVQWLLEKENFVVLDTETTSLNGEICQIAIIGHDGEVLLDTLVKPSTPIEPGATAVHGITNEMVKESADIRLIAKDIAKLIKDKFVVGWNINFDINALHRSIPVGAVGNLESLFDVLTKTVVFDLMHAFSPIYGEWNHYHQDYKWQKLTTAAGFYDIDTDGAHSAVDDCRMTLEVMKHIAEEL